MKDPQSRSHSAGQQPRRSSLIMGMPRELHEAVLNERAERGLRSALAEHLLRETSKTGFGHIVLAAVVAVLAWGVAQTVAVLVWLAVVATSTAVRAFASHRLVHSAAPPEPVTRFIRTSITVDALAWGAGATIIGTGLPFQDFTIMLVVFAGLVARATATLVADRLSFYGFTAALLVPLAAGILLAGQTRSHLVVLALVVLFAGTMVALFHRSHARLVHHLRTSEWLEIRKAKTARERSFLDALLSSAPSAIAVVEANGHVRGVNPSFERLFGLTAEESVGHDLNSLIVPQADRSNALEFQKSVYQAGPASREVERLTKDGSLIPVRVSAAPVEGSAEGSLIVLYDDITETKLAEQALREAEERYRELVESASDLLWQIDGDGRWTFLNASSRRIYGRGPEELLGTPLTDVVDPAHLEDHRKAFAKLLEGEEITDYETTHRNSEGEPKHLNFAARPVTDETGAIVGAQGIARDVSDRVAAWEALEKARTAAEQSAEAQRTFFANMSHEIRTPMNGILGMVEILLETELTPEQRRSAELARSSADSLLWIINDILDFSKIEAGRFTLEQAAFDLPGLLDNIVGILAVPAMERNIGLTLDIPDDVPRVVCGDPGRLRQVVTNLVGNAVKFTHEGEVLLSASLETLQDGDAFITFVVRDSGIGIPPDKINHIFEEFTQADPSTTRIYGGTGLGLPISRRIVRMMGGDIEVRSEVGRGSEFRFTVVLPVEPDQRPLTARRDLGELRETRALIVDDNPTNRRILANTLGAVGVTVQEASGTDNGLATMRQALSAGAPFDFAIVDASMPGKDGFELAEAALADPTLSKTKLMMLTAAGQRGDGQRCRNLGVSAYLTKPVPRVELLEAVAMLAGSEAAAGHHGLITRHSINESRPRLTILVVEDNPVNQEVATTMLKKRGYSVDVVDNGREAVEAVQTEKYDVILMDLQLPELDGFAATAAIRSDPRFEKLPIVAVTAHALPGEYERCLARGMSGHLAKPFKPHELYAAVEGWGGFTDSDPSESAPIDLSLPIDLEGFRRTMRQAGIEDTVERVLEVFMMDAPRRMETLERAVADGDAQTIETTAHAFKSAAVTVEARRLAQQLDRIEKAGKNGNSDSAADLVDALRNEHEAVLTCLREELERSQPKPKPAAG